MCSGAMFSSFRPLASGWVNSGAVLHRRTEMHEMPHKRYIRICHGSWCRRCPRVTARNDSGTDVARNARPWGVLLLRGWSSSTTTTSLLVATGPGCGCWALAQAGCGWELGRPMPAQRGLVSVLGQATTGELSQSRSGRGSRSTPFRGTHDTDQQGPGPRPREPFVRAEQQCGTRRLHSAPPTYRARRRAHAIDAPPCRHSFLVPWRDSWPHVGRRGNGESGGFHRPLHLLESSLPFAFVVAGPLLLFAPHHSK